MSQGGLLLLLLLFPIFKPAPAFSHDNSACETALSPCLRDFTSQVGKLIAGGNDGRVYRLRGRSDVLLKIFEPVSSANAREPVSEEQARTLREKYVLLH